MDKNDCPHCGQDLRLPPDAFEKLEILKTCDNQPTKHLLLLIAEDLEGSYTSKNVKRARANWLIGLVNALKAE